MSAIAVGESTHHHTTLSKNAVPSKETGFFWYLLRLVGLVTGQVSSVRLGSLRTCVLVCFLFIAFLPQMSSAQVTLSGTVFTDAGITPAGAGLTVRAVLGTSTPSVFSTTTRSGGVWDLIMAATSTGGVTWATSSASGNNDTWNAVTYGNGRFVAVGESAGDNVMTSTSSLTWATTSAVGNNDVWKSVAFGNGRFVAVGSSSSDNVMTSTDGLTWATTSAAGNNDNWNFVTFGNGRFVAVGENGDRAMTSTDGLTWTAASPAGNNDTWRSVTYGNGRFVAVGDSGDRVMTSTDGLTWATTSAAGNDDEWNGVTYGNGLYVAVSDLGDKVMTSTDGLTWATTSAAGNNDNWRAVAYGNGRFVAVADTNGVDKVMYSTDGLTWVVASAAGNNDHWRAVAYGNGRFVAVALSGDRVMGSDAGFGVDIPVTLWVDATTTIKATTYLSGLIATSTLTGVDLHQNTLISRNATTNATTSVNRLSDLTFYDTTDDGDILYEAPVVGTTTIRGSFRVATGTTLNTQVVEVQGNFIQDGDWRNSEGTLRLAGVNSTVAGTTTGINTLGATMLSPSSDGTSWQKVSVLGNDDRWNGFAYGNGIYVAVGSGSGADRVMTSPDGINWTTRSVAGNDDAWQDIIYANGRFVAVSNSGDRVIYSDDGLTWATTTAAGNDDGWSAVTYGAGLFVAVGTFGNNRVMTSPDGITWTGRTSILSDNDNWKTVIFGNGTFVALGEGVGADRIMTSTNGTAWVSRSTVDNWWQDIAYANGRFVAVSNFGSRVMTSSDGTTWATTTVAGDNEEWSGVAYGNGVFLAVASGPGGTADDRVMTSPDGIVWTTRPTLDNNDNWVAVDYINGRFFAGSGNIAPDTDRFMISNFGQLTIASTSSATDTTIEYGTVIASAGVTIDVSGNLTGNGLLQNNGQLLLTGVNKNLSLLASTSELLSTLGSTTITGSYTSLRSATTSNLTIDSGGTLTIPSTSTVAIGGNFTQNGFLNNNGTIAFTGTSSFATGTLTGTNNLGNISVQMGSNGQAGAIINALGDDDNWEGITYGNGLFVAVGTFGDRIMTSPDGLTWTAVATSSAAGNDDNWRDVTYGNGRFVAVGTGLDRVMYSDNGLTWATSSAAGNNDFWDSVTYGNGRFVAVASLGGNDYIMTSTDGLTWTAIASSSAAGNNDRLNSVTYGNGRFVAVGQSGDRVITSPDGLTWTAVATSSAAGNNDSWQVVTYGNGLFVAGGSSGGDDRFMTSPDGLAWTATNPANTPLAFNHITYGKGRFVSVRNLGMNPVMVTAPGSFTLGATASITDTFIEYGEFSILEDVTTEIAGDIFNSGDFYNTGQIILTGSNKILSMQTVPGAIPSLGSTTVRGSYTALTNSSTTNLTIDGGATLGIASSATVAINGNFTQNGSFDNDGTIMFTGTNNQASGSLSGANDLGNVVLEMQSDATTWTSYSVLGDDDNWTSVTYGNGRFVAVGSGPDVVMTSTDGLTWATTSAAGNNDSWQSVTYSNGLFVAVSNSGDRVMTSTDGLTWATTSAAGNDDSWQSVTYGNGLFVAVGDSLGGDRVMTSTDGLTWTVPTHPLSEWVSVTYGNGRFVAVSYDEPRTMISFDGLTWATTTPVSGYQWSFVTYGQGLFVALAESPSVRAMTSPDGMVWTDYSVPDTGSDWQYLTYGGGQFLAVGRFGDHVMTSPDGASWISYGSDAGAGNWSGAVYHDGRFVAVGDNGGSRHVMTSNFGTLTLKSTTSAAQLIVRKGTLFSTSSLTVSGPLVNFAGVNIEGALSLVGVNQVIDPLASASTSVAYLGDTTITGSVTFKSGATMRSATIDPGASVTAPVQPLSIQGNFTQNGTFRHRGLISLEGSSSTVSGDFTGANLLGTVVNNASSDGTEWLSASAAEANTWNSVAYGNGVFVAVSSGGAGGNRVMTSSDGVNWVARSAAGNDDGWQSVTFGNGVFVAVGNAGDRVMTSINGVSWVAQSASAGSDDGWNSVTFAEGRFVAVGAGGGAVSNFAMVSKDGESWSMVTEAEQNSWQEIAYGNGSFVAVASNGTNRVMTSIDGFTWSTSSAAEANQWQSVTYGNGRFVAISFDGTNRAMTSQDGINWTAQATPAGSSGFAAITFGNGVFVATTLSGTPRIVTSSDGITWTAQTAPEANQWRGITYGNGLFMGVAGNGTNRVMTSGGRTLFVSNATTLGITNSPSRRLQLGTSTLTVLQNYTNNGTLNAGSSTVILAGINQQVATGTLSASSSFHNLTITNIAAQGSSSQAVVFGAPVQTTGTFSMTPGTSAQFRASATSTFQNINLRGGATTTPVFLRSSTFGTQALINVLGNQELVGNVNVSDSRSVGATNIVCTNCANIGNNTNWTFNALTVGGLTLGNHSLGQVPNLFSGINQNVGPLFAFSLTPSGESSYIQQLALQVEGRRNIATSSVVNVVLWRDNDSTRTLTGSDLFIATGTAVYSEQSGSITFATPFTATTTRDYLVTAGTVDIRPNQSFTLSLPTVAILANGASTTETIFVSGSVLKIQHGFVGGNGAGSSIGEAAPAGAGVTSGGGSGGGVGGGAGAGGGDTGANITPSPDFRVPSATGDIFSAWNSGSSAYISDGVRATSSGSNAQQSYNNFGFSIPTGNTISGISVKLDASGSTAAGTIAVSLSWDGGSTFTSTIATPTLSGSDVVYTIGGPSNLWGRTWSPDEFSNGNFRLVVTAQPGSNTVQLDAIAVSVYHVAGGGGAGGGAGGGGI